MSKKSFQERLKDNTGLMNEARFSITGRGLKKPTKLAVHKNHEYFMGASSHPDHIIVTRVTKDTIYYRMHPYNKERRIERWIGEDLISKGVQTWLRSGYVKYQPDLAVKMRAALAGKKSQEVDYREFQKMASQ